MSNPVQHHKINYIEFTTTSIEQAKHFYSTVFGWSFQDYGPDYSSFSSASAGIDGGFSKGDPPPEKSSPLIVLYSKDLKATEAAIVAAGGSVVVPTFEFPGGRRFHFSDGAGNILAVWSEADVPFNRLFSDKQRVPPVSLLRPGIRYTTSSNFQFTDGGSISALRGPSSSRTSVSPRMHRSNRSESRANKGASCSYSNRLNWLTM